MVLKKRNYNDWVLDTENSHTNIIKFSHSYNMSHSLRSRYRDSFNSTNCTFLFLKKFEVSLPSEVSVVNRETKILSCI